MYVSYIGRCPGTIVDFKKLITHTHTLGIVFLNTQWGPCRCYGIRAALRDSPSGKVAVSLVLFCEMTLQRLWRKQCAVRVVIRLTNPC